LSSTDVGTIFLDAKLQVRKMTPQIGETFNLLPTDIGRPIESFTHTIDHPELMADLRRVLEREDPIEREIRDREGRAFFMRVLPYRAKGTVVGVVLTLISASRIRRSSSARHPSRSASPRWR
jgi:two-component system CheB/CheR fusion protein